uniref:Insect cytokine uENF2 n=2 Tax=Neogurelca himachala sangaica TaxID=656750 RepID=E1CEG4_9NEOP|nr:insect cytokine precursor uENF2 [Neogurelca himachala sangaica]
MDVKVVLFITVLILGVCLQVESGVVFNFHEKLKMATSTTTENIQSGQIIRVPELECPLGQRRDALGNCRQRF